MTLTSKIGVWAVIGVGVTVAIALSYRHYAGLVDSKAQLSAQVATLTEDVAREKSRADAYERSIDRWERAAEVQAQALEDNTTAQREAGTYARELKHVLSTHDLGALAKRKPGLIERRANDGTARAFSLLEQSTQGPAAAGATPATGTDSAKP